MLHDGGLAIGPLVLWLSVARGRRLDAATDLLFVAFRQLGRFVGSLVDGRVGSRREKSLHVELRLMRV